MLSDLTDKTIHNNAMISEKALQPFGLDSKKAKVYLAALELGTAKAFEIARKAKLERPTTYDILAKLSKDGLISSYDKRGVAYFVAEDPEKIKRKLQDQEHSFEQLLPELKSLYSPIAAKPKIRFYDGVEGIKTILENIINAKNKQIKGVLSIADLFDSLGEKYMEDYFTRRIQKGVSLRVIRSLPKEVGKERWPTDKHALRELRYSPARMVFGMTMYIYDHTLVIISSKKEDFGMMIESQELSKNISHLFEALWQISEPDIEV